MDSATTLSLSTHCQQCALRNRCLPRHLDTAALQRFDAIVQRGRPLRQGAHCFNAGESFRSIYVVRQGAIKTYSMTEEGEEQVTGFYLAGDCFGFDGIHTQRHTNSAKALERSHLCEIPFEELERLCRAIPHLQHYAFQLASHQIVLEQKRMQLMGKRAADARVAYLLLDYIQRATHGNPQGEILLPMSRYDIANYLGLSVETVSRLLSRLLSQGIIDLQGRRVKILSLERLRAQAHMDTATLARAHSPG